VSTSHGIVGATVGYTLVLTGTAGIRWEKIAFIGGLIGMSEKNL
jgi:phosphate/sulfate permease